MTSEVRVSTLSERFPSEMMPVRAIRLTKGQVAIIDPEDHRQVRQYKWHAVVRRNKSTKYWAANGYVVGMHTLLTGYVRTDHVNGDPLDNRRINLRDATGSQNSANTTKYGTNSSQYKGVERRRRSTGERWAAHITVRTRRHWLGTFDTDEEAARAYDDAVREHFGEYGRYNFPREGERQA
jgi:hypothetical protein